MKRRSYPAGPGRKVSPFVLLDLERQRAAVLKLADSRTPDHGIAQITGLDVATVRRWIAERGLEQAHEAP